MYQHYSNNGRNIQDERRENKRSLTEDGKENGKNSVLDICRRGCSGGCRLFQSEKYKDIFLFALFFLPADGLLLSGLRGNESVLGIVQRTSSEVCLVSSAGTLRLYFNGLVPDQSYGGVLVEGKTEDWHEIPKRLSVRERRAGAWKLDFKKRTASRLGNFHVALEIE